MVAICSGMGERAAEDAFLELAQRQELFGVDLYTCKNDSDQGMPRS